MQSSSSGLRYKVQLDFGVAFLRSDVLVHHLPTGGDASNGDRHNADSMHPMSTLIENSVSFFATESIYLFLRFYCLLVDILSRVKVCIETGVITEQNDFAGVFSTIPIESANTANGKMRTFKNVLSGIKDYIQGEFDSKTLETRCRALSRTSVHLTTALPKLLENLHHSFSSMSQEGLLIPLFGYSLKKPMVSTVSVEFI